MESANATIAANEGTQSTMEKLGDIARGLTAGAGKNFIAYGHRN